MEVRITPIVTHEYWISSHLSHRLPPHLTSSSLPLSSRTDIRFKSAIRSGDYFSAVGHLHSFFDHTITLQLSASDTPYSLAI
jgi:hypothetical protein